MPTDTQEESDAVAAPSVVRLATLVGEDGKLMLVAPSPEAAQSEEVGFSGRLRQLPERGQGARS